MAGKYSNRALLTGYNESSTIKFNKYLLTTQSISAMACTINAFLVPGHVTATLYSESILLCTGGTVGREGRGQCQAEL